MFREDDLVPIAALQHYAFCARQCALIHVERSWAENRWTAEGQILHETVDAGCGEGRGDLRIARALPLRSLELGLVGRADAVELHRARESAPEAAPRDAVRLPGVDGWWRPYPVETKRGRPKDSDCDRVQVCAQALCLEEMLNVRIEAGALFYATPRRREEVLFDIGLRQRTQDLVAAVRSLLVRGETPAAVWEPKCRRCSLIDLCLPKAGPRSAQGYLASALGAVLHNEKEDS